MKITSDNWVDYWGKGMFALLLAIPLSLINPTIGIIFLFLVGGYIIYCAEKGYKESMKEIN